MKKHQIRESLTPRARRMLWYKTVDRYLKVSEVISSVEMFEIEIWQIDKQRNLKEWEPIYVWGEIDKIALFLNKHIYKEFYKTYPNVSMVFSPDFKPDQVRISSGGDSPVCVVDVDVENIQV